MYVDHFGFEKRPFSSKVAGSDVFVGPRTARAMSAIQKALAADDAVVTVSGPVGVGKTTIVKRALEVLGDNRIIIRIGRLKLGYDEVIELLLAGLRAKKLPKSTVQRFAVFRRLLFQYGQRGTRVFILVEDATCIGVEALAELEALTAEDTGASAGASLVLMATDGLADLLEDPELARLKQRVRLRQTIERLDASEFRGYLNQRLRLAGGAFDSVFAPGTDEALLRISDGVPRVCNNIAEQALTAAAEQGADRVTLELIELSAAEQLGLPAGHSATELKSGLAQAEVERRAAETELASDLSNEAKLDTIEVDASTPEGASAVGVEEHDPGAVNAVDVATTQVDEPATVDATQRIETLAMAELPITESASTPADDAAEDTADEQDIPELIQDTVTDLSVLAPEFDAALRADDEFAETDVAVPDIAAASPDGLRDAESPQWESEPTLAELKPDLDALERAIAVARGNDDAEEAAAGMNCEAPAEQPTAPEPVITLDREIQAKIDEATEALRQTLTDVDASVAPGETQPANGEAHQSLEATLGGDEKVEPLTAPATDESATGEAAAADQADVARNPKADSAEIEEMARQLSKVKTIEEMDDKLAETMFGDEFSMIAAQIAASVASGVPANDELELEQEETEVGAEPPAADPDLAGPQEPDSPSAQAADMPPESNTLDTSASQRLATVRALNKGGIPAGAPPVPEPSESIVLSAQPDIRTPANGPEPEPIEQQMNTSMTQTLKALNARHIEQDEDEEQPKRGFFSRFRRS